MDTVLGSTALHFASVQSVKVILGEGENNRNETGAIATVTLGRAQLSLAGTVCIFQPQRLEPPQC